MPSKCQPFSDTESTRATYLSLSLVAEIFNVYSNDLSDTIDLSKPLVRLAFSATRMLSCMNMPINRVATNLSFDPSDTPRQSETRAQPRKVWHTGLIAMVPCNHATQNPGDSTEHGWQFTWVEFSAFGEFSKLLLSSAPDMRYLPGFADHCDLIFLTAVLITRPWGWGKGGMFKEGFASDTR